MISNARSLALKTLMRVLNNDSYSNISLNNNLRASRLKAVDRRLATRLVYGTIQYKIFLAYQLRPLIKSKLKEDYIEPLLLVSAYQLFFLDKIPASAVLDQANRLAKQFGRKHSGGYRLVNGVLRNLIRQGVILPPADQVAQYLSIKESFPKWLVHYFLSNWGNKRTISILRSLNKIPKNSVRVGCHFRLAAVSRELEQEGYQLQPSRLAARNLILDHGGAANTKIFKEGKITIQDEAASLAVAAFDFKGDEEVLDACSAPGGKTVQIADHLASGWVTALDIHPKKLRLVSQNLQRVGLARKLKTKAIDARKADQYFSKGQFAKILVDAPCSGLGLMRRKPEIRYTKKLQDLHNLQQVQLAILNKVSPLLQQNGELVYSTCTLSREENEEVVKQFLRVHPDFCLAPFQLAKINSSTGMLRIMPDDYNSDGFFIAKFKLRG